MTDTYQFVDFGAGQGRSFEIGANCVGGVGLAIDKSKEAVDHCRQLGYAAEVHDVLTFTEKNVAQASVAVNLMQELSSQQEVRTALVNMVRTATNFIVIQHPFYDQDGSLAAKGLLIEEHFDKKTLYKPTLADYVAFMADYGQSLSLVGMAAYLSGEIVAKPSGFPPSADLQPESASKTMRVVIGRKNLARFRRAQSRAEMGKLFYVVETAE
jgi:hypothetical protein